MRKKLSCCASVLLFTIGTVQKEQKGKEKEKSGLLWLMNNYWNSERETKRKTHILGWNKAFAIVMKRNRELPRKLRQRREREEEAREHLRQKKVLPLQNFSSFVFRRTNFSAFQFILLMSRRPSTEILFDFVSLR